MNTSSSIETLFTIHAGVCMADLMLSALVLLASTLNWHVVRASAVLHRNLKAILSFQSLTVVAFALCRCTHIFVNLWLVGTFNDEWPAAQILIAVEKASVGLFVWTGYALLVERIYATWLVDHYERVRGNGFLAGWALALMTIGGLTFADSMRQQDRVIGSVVICASYGCITFNILAYICLISLHSYNKKRYSDYTTAHSLSERYQLAENIRTIRQLYPVFLLHLVGTSLGEVAVFAIYYQIVTDVHVVDLTMDGMYIVLTAMNVGIQIVVVTHHPILKRHAIEVLFHLLLFWRRNRVSEQNSANGHGALPNRVARHPIAIEGKQWEAVGPALLNSQAAMDQHFKTLNELWNAPK